MSLEIWTPILSHGQLYVALSRTTSINSLKIFLPIQNLPKNENIIFWNININFSSPNFIYNVVLPYLFHSCKGMVFTKQRIFYWNLLPPLWLHCHHQTSIWSFDALFMTLESSSNEHERKNLAKVSQMWAFVWTFRFWFFFKNLSFEFWDYCMLFLCFDSNKPWNKW